ncbi:MAG TPA: ABC transporter substrate-binding protein [Streptosporangiaceae bacterium]|jgi:peptide/nickel transport system substrate-binding protein|nr:ABC transporter substrate-binding protein [Streptosporangiaceae bacterium]
MSHRYLKGVAAAMILGLGVAACSSSGHSGSTSSGSSGKTLTVTEEANTGVTFTKNFNPFDVNSLASQLDMKSLLWEPLFEFDALKPGVIHPELGTKYAWSNSGKTLTVNLRTGVKFSDGTSFTSADAAYTFNTINSNAAANYSGLPALNSVTTPNASTVVLHFKAPEYANIFSILGDTFMVPKHVFSSLGNVATTAVTSPVGSGPYVLKSFTTQLVTFTANPKWWGGKPSVTQVDIPYYSGNQAATTALAAGQLDWAGNEIPNLQQLYTSKDPTNNHYWFPGGNTVTLWINVAKGGPLADVKVRQAISAGINRQQLSAKGEYGYEAPATSSSGLILPAQQQFLDPKLANDISATANASKVASILSGDGYKKDSKGIWAKNGQEISFSVEDPTAYTDYFADAQLISSQLKAVGINATVDGVAAPSWFTDTQDGNFQTAVHWGGGAGGTSDPYPFGQYQYWMDNTLTAKIGASAASNYGRYSNTQAQNAITAFENTDVASAQQTQLDTLENLESTELPTIPLMYGADWNEYSTARISGWATQSNPYMDPAPDDPEVGYILTQLKPAS